MRGNFFYYVNLFYATRYPERKLTFYNCGISGEDTDEILERMESDILIHRPTWCALLINDLSLSLYGKERQNEPGIREKQIESLNSHFRNVDSIVQKLLQANSKVILQTHPIYDQTASLPSENAYGANDDLKVCAEYFKRLAAKYKLPIVDYWTILNEDNKKIQLTDSTKSIISRDRLHPGKLGYFVMAYQFLNSPSILKKVSHLTVDAKRNKISQQFNCTIGNLKATNKSLSFTYLGKSLPFPSPDGLNIDSLHPFTKELNTEIVQVKGLATGNYRLVIDTNVTGIYSNKELEKGINIPQNENTPQYQQASLVLNLFNDYWKTERVLRTIKYVEYQHRLNRLKNKDDMAEVKKKFAKTLEKNKSGENYVFFKNVFGTYLTNKPQEKELESKLESLQTSIYQINTPCRTYL